MTDWAYIDSFYIWMAISAVGLILLGIGIILVAARSRSRKSDPRMPSSVVHNVSDVSWGMEKTGKYERPAKARIIQKGRPAPSPDFQRLRSASSRFETTPYQAAEKVSPVGPLTAWDLEPRREKPMSKAFLSQGKRTEEVLPEPTEVAQAPVMPAPAARQSAFVVVPEPLPIAEPKPATDAPSARPRLSTIPQVEKTVVEEEKAAVQLPPPPQLQTTSRPQAAPQTRSDARSLPLDMDQTLLLMKSHELLLTLSDGLKKLSNAKTDSSRKEKIDEMLTALKLLDAKSEWDGYKSCFEKFNPEFWNRLRERACEEMTPFELRLCAMLAMGMNSKDIAELSNRSVRTVETAVYKIRKKLGMEAEEKTADFLRKMME